MDKFNKYHLYLGPKYQDAICAFHEHINSTGFNGNSKLIRIPCESYTSQKPEKDKKKRMNSEKNKKIRAEKIHDTLEEIHKLGLVTLEYNEKKTTSEFKNKIPSRNKKLVEHETKTTPTCLTSYLK